MRWQSIAIAILLVALGMAGYAAMIVVATHVELPRNFAGVPGRPARWQQLLIMLSPVVATLLLGVWLAIGVDDRQRQRLIPLYLALLALIATLTAFLGLLGITTLDAVLHTPRQWLWLNDPEVRLVNTLLYAGMVGAIAWLIGVVVQGRRRGGGPNGGA